ncbi:MAG: hypothetical protein M3377_08035 [Actinomycetota bacterium]|nr:hypothetical protein [Actinomycetota bacterium]
MSGVPNPMTVKSQVSGSFGAVGPVSLAGIPDTFHLDVTNLPKIRLGVDPISMQATIDPVEVATRISIERIPDIRAHLPANFSVGLSLLGLELLCLRLCGEGQVITEPYRPNPCERCGAPSQDRDGKSNEPRIAVGRNG